MQAICKRFTKVCLHLNTVLVEQCVTMSSSIVVSYSRCGWAVCFEEKKCTSDTTRTDTDQESRIQGSINLVKAAMNADKSRQILPLGLRLEVAPENLVGAVFSVQEPK